MNTISTRPMIRDELSCKGRKYRVTAIADPIVVAKCVKVPDHIEPKTVDDIKIFVIDC